MYSQVDDVLFEGDWHRSNILIIAFVVLLTIALGVIAFLSLPSYWKIALVIVLLTYSARVFLKDILFGLPSSFTAIRKTSKNWFIYNEEKNWQVIKLCPDQCVVLSWGIVLVFFCGENNRRLNVCLLKSSFVFDDFRQLVVYLRYGLK